MLRKRLIGIGVIVAAVTVAVLATVRPDPFADTESIYARFDSAQGIGSIDRNVRVGGANAGHIGEVRREGDDVIVELVLEKGIRVAEDSHAELRPHTIFEGSAFVDLFPGSPNSPDLEEGAIIPEAQTDVYVSVDEATRVLRTENRKKLKRILHSSVDVLGDDAVAGLRKALRESPELLDDLGKGARALQGPKGDELAGAVDGLSRTLDALANREADLAPLAARANLTAAAIGTGEGSALDRVLAALPGPLEGLARNGATLTSVVDRLDTLAAELGPAARELGPLLSEVRPLLRRTTPIIKDATPLIRGLGTALTRIAGAGPSIEKSVRTLYPGMKTLVESVLPVLTSDGQLGVPVYAQLGAAFAGGTAAMRPYQTAAQGGGSRGHILRLSLYPDPGGLPTVLPACGLIELIGGQGLADQLEGIGLCKP